MTVTALAPFPDDDEPRPVPGTPPCDAIELNTLWTEIYIVLRDEGRETER